MIASIIAAVAGAIRLFSEWMTARRDQLLLALGRGQQRSADLQERIDAIQKANKLREEADRAALRDPGSLLSDDGFRRKGDD